METTKGLYALKASLCALLSSWFSAGSLIYFYCHHMPSLEAFGFDLEDLWIVYGALMVGAFVSGEKSNQERKRASLLRQNSLFNAKSRMVRDSFINNNIGNEVFTF